MGTATLTLGLSLTSDGTGPAPATLTAANDAGWFYTVTVSDVSGDFAGDVTLTVRHYFAGFEDGPYIAGVPIMIGTGDLVDGFVAVQPVPWNDLDFSTDPDIYTPGSGASTISATTAGGSGDTFTVKAWDGDLDQATVSMSYAPVASMVFPGGTAPVMVTVTTSDGYPVPVIPQTGDSAAGLVTLDPTAPGVVKPGGVYLFTFPTIASGTTAQIVDLTWLYPAGISIAWMWQVAGTGVQPAVLYSTVTITGATSGQTDFYAAPGPATAPTGNVGAGSLTLSRIRGGHVALATDQDTGIGAGGDASADVWHIVGAAGEPPYLNGWYASGEGCSFTRSPLPDGRELVEINVVASCGNDVPAGSESILFTLPAGYFYTGAYRARWTTANAAGILYVETSGDVGFQGITDLPANTEISACAHLIVG